ncbi:MAG TPA: SPOR domain-containing protein [Noviherbaspirillum sp.]
MSLFSSLRKNKQEPVSDDSTFYSRAEEDSKKVRSRRRQGGSKAGAPADPVLPEKKRARRRLIGAIALVLAAVIGLPMILDSEPKPVADDIAIQIPSRDKPAPAAVGGHASALAPVAKVSASAALDPREEMIDEPVPGTDAARPASNEVAVKDGVVAGTAAASGNARQEAKPATEAAKLDPADKKLHPDQKPAHKTETKPETKSADKKSDDASRAQALLEGKTDPKAAEKKSGKFAIQVAALATKEKVDELQDKLKNAGIKSYTQKVATTSGDRIRIRVGPFSSKEEAEKMRAKIVKLGLNGTLVPI